jgi:hypothetical protein
MSEIKLPEGCKCDLAPTRFASDVCSSYTPCAGRFIDQDIPDACCSNAPSGLGACGHDPACHVPRPERMEESR